MKQVNEKDWKLFRSRLPGWQEAYMGKLIEEYKALLNSEGQASERFWALEKRVKQDRRNPGVLLHQKGLSHKRGSPKIVKNNGSRHLKRVGCRLILLV